MVDALSAVALGFEGQSIPVGEGGVVTTTSSIGNPKSQWGQIDEAGL